jgi:hypothetical protein
MMGTKEYDIIIIADRVSFEQVREYCAGAGPRSLDQFERNAPLSDFVVMKLDAAEQTCRLAWGRGIGGLLKGIELLWSASAEIRLLLVKGSDAEAAVRKSLTQLGATMIMSGDETIN